MEPSAASCTVSGMEKAKAGRNPNGYPPSLDGNRPAQPNFKHGARARTRPYDECALEIEDELLALPHVPPIDAPACRKIATLMALIERVDVALADGVVEKRNTPRNLIETRRGQANWADERRESGRSADDDLRRYEQRMRAQLANVVTRADGVAGQHSLARLAHR